MFCRASPQQYMIPSQHDNPTVRTGHAHTHTRTNRPSAIYDSRPFPQWARAYVAHLKTEVRVPALGNMPYTRSVLHHRCLPSPTTSTGLGDQQITRSPEILDPCGAIHSKMRWNYCCTKRQYRYPIFSVYVVFSVLNT